MNKIQTILTGLCMVVCLSSCEDFLTVSSPDQLTSESFWRNKSDVEAALAAAYSQMYHMAYHGDEWTFAEVKWPVEAYREDIVEMGNDAMNYQNWVELYNFTYTNGNSQFSTYWENYYRGVCFANQVIEKTAEIPDNMLAPSEKSHLIAEAHFLRGYYYMQLLLNWKEIVIREHYITSGEASVLDKTLSSRTEAWDIIVEDMKMATDLPSSYDADNMGRATCGAAYAYLGYAYLTRAYEEANRKSEYLAAAIDAFNHVTGYSLVSDFASLFDGTNKNNSESIFEMQFSLSDANGALYRTQLHYWIGCGELGGWDEILPSQTLINEFKKEGMNASTGLYDSRFYGTVFFQSDFFNDGTGKVLGHDYDYWFEGVNRPVFRKLLPSTEEAFGLDDDDVNIPLMRYANVLLMKAEALNEQGYPEQAIPLINEVRRTHGNMPAMTGTTAIEVQAQIEHERMLEFPLENLRWYDLRRWGKLASALSAAGRSGFNEEANAFYPVPQVELNANKAIK